LLDCEVIVLRIASNGLPQVIHETWMTGKRLFLCAAGEGSDGKVVNVLAYRIVSGHVKVLFAQKRTLKMSENLCRRPAGWFPRQ